MADTLDAQSPHRRPHPQPMAATFLEFDLAREIEQLHSEPDWSTGQNAKTLVKYPDLRIVITALRAERRMPGHQTDGRISIQTVQGRVQVRADGRTFDLPAGRVLTLDRGIRHDVEAVEDSAILLTIAWPER